MNKYNQTFAYSFRERTIKRGLVYDIIFRIVDEKGKEVQKAFCGFATKTKAKQAYNDFMSTYVAPVKKCDVKGKLIFEVVKKQYFEAIKNQVKESTLYDKTNIFRLYIEPSFVGKDIAGITKQDIYVWQDAIWSMQHDGKPYDGKYLIKIRNYFSVFLQWCAERFDSYNPFQDVKVPKQKIVKRQMQIWERSEFEQYITVVDDNVWHMLFSSLYFSGCRIGEMLSLQDKDVSNGEFVITKSLTRKTLDKSVYKITGTKNEKHRTIPIPDCLNAELLKYLDWKKENNISTDFLFGGKQPLPETTIRRVFDKFTELSNVKRIRIHDLRHSYVSLLVHLGANLTVVANLIGDTLEQVVKTYAHMYESDKKLLINKM